MGWVGRSFMCVPSHPNCHLMTDLTELINGLRAFRVFRCLPLALCVLLLNACGLQQVRVSDVMHGLDTGGSPEQALAQLSQHEPSKDSKDRVHYLLNAGLLKQLSGDVRGSADTLNEAKQRIQALDAISPTEFLGSITINDTLKSYIPSPSERVLIHAVQIQNYLALGELDSARVEVLQADLLLREYRKKHNKNAQLASVYYLMGAVFEMSGEWDDALIAYRRAQSQIGEGAVPKALQQALMISAYKTGNMQEFDAYVRDFSPSSKTLKALKANSGWATVLGVYWQGRSVEKISSQKAVFSEELGQSISLALPVYESFRFTALRNQSPYALASSQNEKDLVMARYLDWQPVESVNDRLKTDLSDALVGVTARMIARAVVKHQVKHELAKKHGEKYESGLLALEFLSLFLERADTRGWSALPANILISRARVPMGDNTIQSPVGENGQSTAVTLSNNQYYVLYKNDLAGTRWLGHVFP